MQLVPKKGMVGLYNSETMNNPIENLNKIFDSRIRLGIMSALMVNAEVNFNDLKELLTYSVTKAGEKAFRAHIEALEKMIRLNK